MKNSRSLRCDPQTCFTRSSKSKIFELQKQLMLAGKRWLRDTANTWHPYSEVWHVFELKTMNSSLQNNKHQFLCFQEMENPTKSGTNNNKDDTTIQFALYSAYYVQENFWSKTWIKEDHTFIFFKDTHKHYCMQTEFPALGSIHRKVELTILGGHTWKSKQVRKGCRCRGAHEWNKQDTGTEKNTGMPPT